MRAGLFWQLVGLLGGGWWLFGCRSLSPSPRPPTDQAKSVSSSKTVARTPLRSPLLRGLSEYELSFAHWFGRQAPQLEATDLEGRPHRLSTYRGKVVFLNVWATWCPPCREEMPHLIELYREYRDRGFVLLALSDKVNDTVEAQRRFAQVYNVPFPLLMVESLSQLPKPYSLVSVFPTTFLIRADGTLAVVKGGVLSKEEGETLLRLLLEERKGPSSASSPSS